MSSKTWLLLGLSSLLVIGCAPPVAEPVAASEDSVDWDSLLPNPQRPEEGLLTGGQPSLEQLEAIRDAGFRTVINLRAEGEKGAKAEAVEALGMRYVALPIRGAESLTEDSAEAFAAVLAAAERPAIVHCGSGNRVGALFALKAFYVDGAEVEEAYEVGRRAGLTRLSGSVRQILDEASAD